MLEASAQPVMVPGWWRRWPAWSTYAAMAWSMIYGALALSWEAGAPGFPFGEGDPEGAAMARSCSPFRPSPPDWSWPDGARRA